MDEIRYLISDASKKVDVEAHVLRYWEEELGIAIPRNEMGHRYYTEFHIRLFCQVKKLKDKGYQLKAIKSALLQVMEQKQKITETASVLEQDIARTLKENPKLKYVCRLSLDEKGQEAREDPAFRFTDYSRLEKGGEIMGLLSKAFKQEKEKQGIQAVQELREKQGIQKIQEIEEKDGQMDMKNKGRNRKKPSAWERRNGMAAGRKGTFSEEKDEGRVDEERSWKEKAEEEKDTDQNGGIKAITAGTEKGENREEEKGTGRYVTGREGENGYGRSQEKENRYGMIQGNENGYRTGWDGETGAESARELDIEEDAEEGEETTEETGLAVQEGEGNTGFTVITQQEKLEQFEKIMNHIIGKALEANNEKMGQDISRAVSENISGELAELMRIQDQREEERFRHLDETIRSCQRGRIGMAEAAAAKVPFFRKRRF